MSAGRLKLSLAKFAMDNVYRFLKRDIQTYCIYREPYSILCGDLATQASVSSFGAHSPDPGAVLR